MSSFGKSCWFFSRNSTLWIKIIIIIIIIDTKSSHDHIRLIRIKMANSKVRMCVCIIKYTLHTGIQCVPFSTLILSWIRQRVLLFTRIEFFKERVLAFVWFTGPLISHSLWNLAWLSRAGGLLKTPAKRDLNSDNNYHAQILKETLVVKKVFVQYLWYINFGSKWKCNILQH